MKKIWIALAALTVAVACKVESPEGENASPKRFYATIEQQDETRTFVDGEGDNVRMRWTAGDEIAIFASTYGEEYAFTGDTGDTGGDFEKVSESSHFTAGFELNRNYAVYPYAPRLKMNEEGKVQVTLAATQPYAEDSFGLGTGLMTAVTSGTEDTHLTFKNVTGYLKLKVYGGVAVRSISFKGNNNEKLTGTALITIPYGDGAVPSIEVTGDGEVVTLDCGSVMTSEDQAAPTTFWFALPPTVFEKGFTVEVTDVNGLVTTKKSSREIEIKRNVIKPMSAFKLEGQAPEPPTPEIPDLPGWPWEGSKLPCLFVYTPDNVAITSKENWVSGSHAYLRLADETVTDLGTANIRLRGNSTLHYSKKAYAFKLDTKASLLGMPSDKRWDLLANFVDRTRIRNHIAFEMGRRLSGLAWTPKGEFVELFVNGEHMGNYYLVEHIKIAKNRVNIKEFKAGDTDLSGGYLLEFGTEMDEGEGHQFWTNAFQRSVGNIGLPVMVKSPEDEMMDGQKLNWISNYLNNSIQSSILANNGAWLSEVDLDSFVDWMLVQEVVGNYEPVHPKSCFMYKDRGGKLVMGPLWDFDYKTFMKNYTMTPVYHYSLWFGYMMNDATFRAKVRERWPAAKAAFMEVANSLPDNDTDAKAASWMNLLISVDKDWKKWGGLSTSPKVNGDEADNLGIWRAIGNYPGYGGVGIKANLLRRINQFDGTEIPNNFQ